MNFVILAGGKSSRMNMNKNKVLLECFGDSLIDILLKEIRKIDSANIVVVLGYDADSVKAKLQTEKYVIQLEQKGTANAVQQALNKLKKFDYTFIINGDGPFLTSEQIKEIIDYAKNYDLVIVSNEEDINNNFGRVERDANNNITRIVETKDADSLQLKITECNTGVYVIKTDLLKRYIFDIKNNNKQNEFYITDLVEILYKNNKKINSFKLNKNDFLSSVNTLCELSNINEKIKLNINKNLLQNGVYILDVNNCYIDKNCIIKKWCTIYQNVTIKNKTTINQECVVYPNCYIQNCTIGQNCIIGANSVLINVKIKNGEILPPFTTRIKML